MRFEKPQSAKQVGEGGYKKVFHSPTEQGDRVWAEFKHSYTPEQAKSIYYLNNIIHLLFPEHTIKITQSGIDANNQAYLMSEYVSSAADSVHNAIQKEALANAGQPYSESPVFADRAEMMESSEEIQSFIDRYEAAGLRENFAAVHAWGPQDVLYEESGNFRFVDVDPAWEEPEEIGEEGYTEACLRFSPEKLGTAIGQLDGDKKAKAQNLYNRLLALCREVGFKIDGPLSTKSIE